MCLPGFELTTSIYQGVFINILLYIYSVYRCFQEKRVLEGLISNIQHTWQVFLPCEPSGIHRFNLVCQCFKFQLKVSWCVTTVWKVSNPWPFAHLASVPAFWDIRLHTLLGLSKLWPSAYVKWHRRKKGSKKRVWSQIFSTSGKSSYPVSCRGYTDITLNFGFRSTDM